MRRGTRLSLAAAVALLAAAAVAAAQARAGFVNPEPLASQQWYLPADHAWDFWTSEPTLPPVRVAVVDSGIDGGHPDLVGRVVAARSFVGGSAYTDEVGHGTFVAGLIAANPDNGVGIAGLAFNAQLLVAKVVYPDGMISIPAEAAGIRWAVDNGARVINLSIGGVRDPLDPAIDSYSPLEQQAIDYAVAHGVLVVAAAGNGTDAPAEPWQYAYYPAALPHVLGVSAVRRDGSVPSYSNRDAVYVDIAAPGEDMFSTIPRTLVSDPTCIDGPYSDCGPPDLQNAIGTSFAAPQVSAAAALILGVDPSLTPEQLAWLLERYATDATPRTGCLQCATGRDALTGWGTLDVTAALFALTQSSTLPHADAYEPNDDAGPWSHALPPLPRTFVATLDYWDDDVDVYRVTLHRGDRIFARMTPTQAAGISLVLWGPGTIHVEGIHVDQTRRLADASSVGGQERLAYTAPKTGTYYLEARLLTSTYNPLRYRFSVARRPAAAG